MMILATDFHIALRQDLLATIPVPKTLKLFGNDVPTKNDLLLLSTISSGQSKKTPSQSKDLPLVVMVTHREKLGMVRQLGDVCESTVEIIEFRKCKCKRKLLGTQV